MWQQLRSNMQPFGAVVRFGSIVYCFQHYIGEVTMCLGPSMLPTLNVSGDLVFLDRFTPYFKKYEIGQVVIAKSVRDATQTVCKRIVAMEGDYVSVRPRFSQSDAKRILVPKGHVWIEGDNATNSYDSRGYGAVPYCLISGVVRWRVGMIVYYGTCNDG